MSKTAEMFGLMLLLKGQTGPDIAEASGIPLKRIYAALEGREHPSLLFHDSIVKALNLSTGEIKWLLAAEGEKFRRHNGGGHSNAKHNSNSTNQL